MEGRVLPTAFPHFCRFVRVSLRWGRQCGIPTGMLHFGAVLHPLHGGQVVSCESVCCVPACLFSWKSLAPILAFTLFFTLQVSSCRRAASALQMQNPEFIHLESGIYFKKKKQIHCSEAQTHGSRGRTAQGISCYRWDAAAGLGFLHPPGTAVPGGS